MYRLSESADETAGLAEESVPGEEEGLPLVPLSEGTAKLSFLKCYAKLVPLFKQTVLGVE